ncbi:hypothetical protein N9Q05_02605, partial [bacterium]|nr:hypothetical protein [bacterium]
MRDKIEVNINLLCHICLDSDTKGRFGVQGNIFSNTFGYLNQYLTDNKNLPSHLEKFQSIMSNLVANENAILKINDSKDNDLADFANKIKNEIIQQLQSSPEMNIMLPGGWRNPNGGHAMIYQFQKTKEGKLRLSVYNAGAGIDKHERTSFTTTERYYPIKAYDIKQPINEDELSNLISTLVLPQLPPSHPIRKNETYGADKLYDHIARVLPYLKAEPVLATEFLDEKVTTAGQISGTCSQRSIHQLLKINFNDLPNYQRFILDFKMHALRDFIGTHEAPRSKEIANLLKKICINNLKIIMQPEVFNDDLPEDKELKKQLIEELAQLKKQVTADKAIRHLENTRLDTPSTTYSYSIDIPSIAPIYESTLSITQTSSTTIDPLPVLRPTHLLSQLDQLIQLANTQKAQNPLWVFEQIEQAILTLPLPTKPSTNRYESIPFYQSIKTADDYDRIKKQIEQLQQLYRSAYNELLKSTQLPNLITTQMSFLALGDYFNVQNPNQLETTNFNPIINTSLGIYASIMHTCPYAATNNAELDQRLEQIAALYQERVYIDSNQYLRTLYKEIIDTEPDLKDILNTHYKSLYSQDNSDLHQLVRNESLNAVYYLFKQIDLQGNLTYASPLNKTRFQPLLDKIQKQRSFEHFYGHCFDSLFTYHFYPNYELKLDLQPYTSEAKLQITTPASDFSIGYRQIPNDDRSLPNHKYNIKNPSSMRQALIADTALTYPANGVPKKKRGNEIQLSSHDEQSDEDKKNKEPITRIINHEDFFKRELFHLRSSRSNQVNFTLDYFKSNLDKLADQMVQRYMEANIFEPVLLQKTFDSDQN